MGGRGEEIGDGRAGEEVEEEEEGGEGEKGEAVSWTHLISRHWSGFCQDERGHSIAYLHSHIRL